jgi:hypothetical protein
MFVDGALCAGPAPAAALLGIPRNAGSGADRTALWRAKAVLQGRRWANEQRISELLAAFAYVAPSEVRPLWLGQRKVLRSHFLGAGLERKITSKVC